MARQIKFRGKSLKNKKWVYGDLMNNICGTRIVRYKETDNGAKKRADWEYIDVEPDSVGQFTGLTDCNGKEIYEGDILDSKTSDLAPNGYSFICKWIDSGFALIYQGRTYGVKERNNWMNRYPLCKKNVEDLIIRGNVFDNPELLK